VLGCRSLAATPDPREWRPPGGEAAQRWAALRASPWARWIGLALPRILVRLPYGALTAPTERFAFEEFSPGHDHEDYLWGHPAFACATLLARSFRERGWEMSPGDDLELGGLPAHTTREGGESRLQPCAEALLTERALGALLERGLMPFMSFPDRDAVKLVRFQSLADPPATLAGAWA
jgi:type VI secretion system protein ImpC